MLKATKFVIGKLCVHRAFRQQLFAAALPPPKPDPMWPRAEVMSVLEAYEIYVSADELEEIVALAKDAPAGTLQAIIQAVKEHCPVGGAIQEAIAAGIQEQKNASDIRDSVIAAILGGDPASLEGLFALVQCILCGEPDPATANRFVQPRALRCPTWPNCPDEDGND